MYSFDGAPSLSGNIPQSEYYGVAWPAQNMPLEYFSNGSNTRMPWSISMGRFIWDISGHYVHVKLERKGDGRVWEFDTRESVPSDGKIYVRDTNVGQQGCIIFIPDNIEGYEDGDSFHVEIFGTDNLEVAYDVNFFQMHQHSGGRATCKSQARCGYCGKLYGPLAEHRYEKITVSDPSCTIEGEEYEVCRDCYQEKEGDRKKFRH